MTTLRFVGLDVHADTIAIAVAEAEGEVRAVGVIPNTPDALRKALKKLGPAETLRVCYEAGPTGFVVYWQLARLGIACEVVAPTLVPVRPGDRVKTDRRDAIKLARAYRAGELTPVWVPDAAHEALRDLVRAREAAKRDQTRARQRLGKLLRRQGVRPPAGGRAWSSRYWQWLETVRFAEPAREAARRDYLTEVQHAGDRVARLAQAITDQIAEAPAPQRALIAGLQALRGVSQVTAVTVVTEVGTFTRFTSARQVMGYTGLVPREDTSGPRVRRGPITKTGNAHLRRIVVEAAWAYRHPPRVGPTLRHRQAGVSPTLRELAWRAQHRLHRRYRHLIRAGKPTNVATTAIARELLGFLWAMGRQIESEVRPTGAA